MTFACVTLAFAEEKTFFVGTDGKDTNPGTRAAPFATIEGARNVLRSIKKDQPITVYALPGEYVIRTPIVFSTIDSGTPDCPVTYKAWGKPGSARLTGVVPIKGWTPQGKGIYAAQLDSPVHAVFENGVPGIVCREPDEGEGEAPIGCNLLEGGVSKSSVRFKAGQYEQFDHSQALIQLWPLNWLHHHYPVESIDFRSRVISFKGKLTSPGIPHARFFLENAKSFLDESGEFYVDRKSKTLYYKPRKTPIDRQRIGVPVTSEILQIKGNTRTQRVHDLHFEGLAISGADRHVPGQPGFESRGVTIFNAESIELRKLLLENAGDESIFIWSGTSKIRIADCAFRGSRHAIRLWSDTAQRSFKDQATPLTFDISGLTITNNLFRDIGETAIEVNGAKKLEIGFNEISNCQRTGVSLHTVAGCRVHHNHIRRVALQYKDVACGIYVNIMSRNVAIEDNRIHDVHLLKHREGSPSKAIYLDYDANADITVKRNVMFDMARGVKPVKLGGQRITYQHNILDNRGNRGKTAKLQFWGGSHSIRWVPWLVGQEAWDRDMKILGNVFLADAPGDGDFIHFNSKKGWKDTVTVGVIPDTLIASDRNLFFNPAITPDGYRVCGYSIKDWQHLGGKKYDANSRFHTDPQFKNLAAHDYTFAKNSAAIALGIPRLDAAQTSGVGPSPSNPYRNPIPNGR